MRISENVSDLAMALAKAQGAIDDALKDRTNPHFKSRYADLASVRDAIREPLSQNGIAYVQLVRTVEQGVEVETVLMHESGQMLGDVLTMPLAQFTPQGVGSAISYGRRYALMAIVGLAAAEDDDDGNAAQNAGPAMKRPPARSEARQAAPLFSKEESGAERDRMLASLVDCANREDLHNWVKRNSADKGRLTSNDQAIVGTAFANRQKELKGRYANGNGSRAAASSPEPSPQDAGASPREPVPPLPSGEASASDNSEEPFDAKAILSMLADQLEKVTSGSDIDDVAAGFEEDFAQMSDRDAEEAQALLAKARERIMGGKAHADPVQAGKAKPVPEQRAEPEQPTAAKSEAPAVDLSKRPTTWTEYYAQAEFVLATKPAEEAWAWWFDTSGIRDPNPALDDDINPLTPPTSPQDPARLALRAKFLAIKPKKG